MFVLKEQRIRCFDAVHVCSSTKPSSYPQHTIVMELCGLLKLALGSPYGVALVLANLSACMEENFPQRAAWTPEVGAPWQIVLNKPISVDDGALTPDVEIFDIDLFDNPESTFDALHDMGKKVICYFSAGSYEEWRSDAGDFNDEDLGKGLDGWPGENWLDLRSDNVRSIMAKRIKLAADKGCDAVDPDNVDGFQNDNGLGLTAADSTDFVKFLASEAQSHNMAIGLKNAGDIIDDVLSVVDFSVNEECEAWNECQDFAAFIDAGKPVFHIEYPEGAPDVDDATREKICQAPGSDDFSTVIKTYDLDGWVLYCDGEEFETAASKRK